MVNTEEGGGGGKVVAGGRGQVESCSVLKQNTPFVVHLGEILIYSDATQKDPYPVEALLTCNHANLVCSEEKKCTKLFDDFKTSCRFRDRECLMEERESCQAAWHKLKLSPLFGCFCPNHHMKKRCEKIFTMVNHNPCVDG
ncbi:hypothetical protein B566_EDAN015191 [Ephemera danica]|nr:hypothetical protein B566_EDAN015191 [Ephemera danica]